MKIIDANNLKSQQQKMLDSIFPKKFVSAIECTDLNYVEIFNDDLSPVAAIPPFSNTGGINKSAIKSTHSNLTPPVQFSCIVDFLSFTFRLDEFAQDDQNLTDLEKIEFLVVQLLRLVPRLKFAMSEKGLFGYKHSVYLVRERCNVGLIGYGGNNGSCFVSLSGQGCLGVDMWEMRRYIESLPSCKLTRVDMAHDDLEGVTGNIEHYRRLYESGAFSIKGMAPSARFIYDFGSGKGSTLYIGHKRNGKESCIYEKGKQQGDSESKWMRIEGRLTNVDRVIPFETLTEPSAFLAALYPPFSLFSAIHKTVDIVLKQSQICLDHMIEYAAISYGKLIKYLKNQGVTSDKICAMLERDGIPRRLMVPESSIAALCPF